MEPSAPAFPPRKPTLLGRALRAPILIVAVAIVLVDEAFRAVVLPAVRALATLQPVRRAEAYIATLPPYATLALFLIPLAIIEPAKIYGLFLFGQGRWMAGTLTFVAAKVVGLALAERLFAISRDKLLSIGWFAWCYRKLVALKNAVHQWLLATRFWPAAVRLVRRAREALAGVKPWLKSLFGRARGGGLGARLAAARRLVRRGRP
jgi:hypothetical protein